MLSVPDFGILSFLFWALVSVPLVVCAVITILASNAGAQAEYQLPLGRHLYATLVGSVAGLLFFCATIIFGQWIATAVSGSFFAIVAVMLPIVVFATLLGSYSGFQLSKRMSAGLNVYQCAHCAVRFRANFPSDTCTTCAATSDRVNLSMALRKMPDKLAELNDPPEPRLP